jgi:pyruvate dehydrogenase E1 component
MAPANGFDIMASNLDILRALEKKALWLGSWMIHNANHLRESTDGLKVGGHQASSASLATIMTALYFDVLRPEDRVAVKPHASPRLQGGAELSIAHQGRRRCRLFNGLCGIGGRADSVLVADAGLRACAWLGGRPA